MRVFCCALSVLLLSTISLEQAPAAAPKLTKTVLLEATTDFRSDAGFKAKDVLVRVFKDGTVEYTGTGKPEISTSKISSGTVAQLSAFLNEPVLHRLKPSYFLAQPEYLITVYRISYVSGSLDYTVEATNPLMVPAKRRIEYPGALFQLVCAAHDLRELVDSTAKGTFFGRKPICDEFPRIITPQRSERKAR